jgi:group I intron endonuclease
MKGIYKITNIKNDKCYIGESMNIERRLEEHKELLKNNSHHSYTLQHDYNIYGESAFTYDVLEEFDLPYSIAIQEMILLINENKYNKQYNTVTVFFENENLKVDFEINEIVKI